MSAYECEDHACWALFRNPPHGAGGSYLWHMLVCSLVRVVKCSSHKYTHLHCCSEVSDVGDRNMRSTGLIIPNVFFLISLQEVYNYHSVANEATGSSTDG